MALIEEPLIESNRKLLSIFYKAKEKRILK